MKRWSWLAVILIGFTGCAFFEALTTPNKKTGGQAPIDRVGGSIFDLVFNPLNYSAWAELVKDLVIATTAAYGTSKVKDHRHRRQQKALKAAGV